MLITYRNYGKFVKQCYRNVHPVKFVAMQAMVLNKVSGLEENASPHEHTKMPVP